MSLFEYTGSKFESEDGQSSDIVRLPSDFSLLALVKEQTKAKDTLHNAPILKPLKPLMDDRKFEMILPRSKQEIKDTPLTSESLASFETHSKSILDWCKDAQRLLQDSTNDGQLNRLSAECTKGKIKTESDQLSEDILGTVVPRNMPQLVGPWQELKASTRDVVDTFPRIGKAIDDRNKPEAIRLLNQVSDELNQALRDGFDRASAVSDRLSRKQKDVTAVDNLSAEDRQKAAQVKILSAYQTLSHFVSGMRYNVETLSQRPYGDMDEKDWARLSNNYRSFQKELNGLKGEFNGQTMKALEGRPEITEAQKNLLKTFRLSIEKAMPALQSLDRTSPIQGSSLAPVYSGLVEQISDIQKLSDRISSKATHLANELALKKEIKTAPAWKKDLLEQKLVLWQHLPFADGVVDMRNAAFSIAEQSEGKSRIDRLDKFDWARKCRNDLLSADEEFQSTNNVDELQKLEELDKCLSLSAQQIEQLRQFHHRYAQVQPDVEAIRKAVESSDSIDVGAIDSEKRAHLDALTYDRAGIVRMIRDLDTEIYARTLKETTPESLKPLLTQMNSYDEFAKVGEALDDIERGTRDILFLTGGLYSREETAVRMQEEAPKVLARINTFKKLVDTEKQQALSAMVGSSHLTSEQKLQLTGFYSSVQALVPQVEQLERDIQLGPGKNFWKVSKLVREQMDVAHDQAFKILLAGFDLHRKLSDGLKTAK
ncbi:MAG: hypothetical protein K2Y22_13420 [Candidatus Obscuribacterales bacterium]|nr:hypothetical protein [Candidatus Obscuribacterales bacterium]